MKSSQWIGAIVTLAILMFVVTFAMNYIGTSPRKSSDTPGPQPGSDLVFANKKFPILPDGQLADGPLICEHKVPGYHDFWFRNLGDKPVKLRLENKNCKCSNVQLFVLSDEWRRQRAADAAAAVAGSAAAQSLGLFNYGLPGFVASYWTGENDPHLTELEGSMGQGDLMLHETVTIPERADGWVRLRWSAAKEGTQLLKATLLTGSNQGESRDDLEINLAIANPVRAGDQEKRVANPLGAQDLPYEYFLEIWSDTRSHLQVKAQPVRNAGDPADDFLEVGQPVEVGPSGWMEMEKQHKEGPIHSAYRIPVKLLPRSLNGKNPCDIGPFFRLIQVTTDASPDPLVFIFRGEVLGDVSVGDSEDMGHIVFGSFDTKKGTSRRGIILRSDVPGVQLELDRARVPEFFEVHFNDKPEVTREGVSLWKLEVQVLPNRVSGKFPRDDNPAYHDCAVYLKMKGPTSRYVRVPVTGIATDR